MYKIVFNNQIQIDLFFSITDYLKKYGINKVKRHFGINKEHLYLIRQQADTEEYNKIEDMYDVFIEWSKEDGINEIIFDDFVNVILLLICYHKKIIKFPTN